MTEPSRAGLVLRFADIGIATYGSLRVVGERSRTVTWVIEEPLVLAAVAELDAALPEPRAGETVADAIARALTDGAFAHPDPEVVLAYRLGALLLSAPAWQLLVDCAADPRPTLFVAPSARLSRVPWALLALPALRPSPEALTRARTAAITDGGSVAAQINWPTDDIARLTEGLRMMEFADVLVAAPAAVVHGPRTSAVAHPSAAALLVLDPRVPGQLPDSPLGSVLGRPSADNTAVRYFADVLERGPVLPPVDSAIELFRRSDADRRWLADMLARGPGRLLFVGHCTAADPDGSADRAALHLAEADPVTAAALMTAAVKFPPRVALLACASAGDYRFDEATGLVAAMILGGAQVVTAALWSLPTTAGYHRFVTGPAAADPMVELIAAVDEAQRQPDAGCALNRWQRAQMRRWRAGDATASPLYWAAVVTFAVDGAR